MAKSRKKSKKNKGSFYLVMLAIAGLVFLPTSTLLFIGMLPTIVAVFATRGKKAKTITIGAMNLAGCSPFLLELWSRQHTLETSLEIIVDPWVIIVMYSAAGVGYVLDWGTEGIVANFMLHNATLRKKQIEKIQQELIDRWGIKVTGRIPLDSSGFPLDGSSGVEPRGEEPAS